MWMQKLTYSSMQSSTEIDSGVKCSYAIIMYTLVHKFKKLLKFQCSKCSQQAFSPWRRVHAAAVLWRNKEYSGGVNNQPLECKHSNSVPKALTHSTASRRYENRATKNGRQKVPSLQYQALWVTWTQWKREGRWGKGQAMLSLAEQYT